jgi:NAD(P)-dependent dehydrogenase (short-subunit alcohol dehydrogenase family)
MSAAEWDRVQAVNLRGVWLCLKYELQHMQQQGNGAVVNCSSVGGFVTTAGHYWAVYIFSSLFNGHSDIRTMKIYS